MGISDLIIFTVSGQAHVTFSNICGSLEGAFWLSHPTLVAVIRASICHVIKNMYIIGPYACEEVSFRVAKISFRTTCWRPL